MRDKSPLIPAGATVISQDVAVIRGEKAWIYTLDLLPIDSHEADDHQHFRLIIAQLVEAGACRPCEIVNGKRRDKDTFRFHKSLQASKLQNITGENGSAHRQIRGGGPPRELLAMSRCSRGQPSFWRAMPELARRISL